MTLAKALLKLAEKEGKIMVPVMVAKLTPDNDSDEGVSLIVGDHEFGIHPVLYSDLSVAIPAKEAK